MTVSFGELLRTFTRVGLLSFGGPAGRIAVMHRILVEEKRWVSEGRFLHAPPPGSDPITCWSPRRCSLARRRR